MCAAPAYAATVQADAAPLSDTTVVVLDEVSVKANRASSTTPVAFTNVSRKEIERINLGKDLPYLLATVPSVVTNSDAGAGVGYTAMRVRGTDGTRINVTANGVPINDPESHMVYFVDMPDLASSLRDIQVQRGVGTSTNGAGAFGASVNMLTASPKLDPTARLDASYGSYNTNKETVYVSSGLLGDHWAVDARLSHIGSDGYIDRATSEMWGYMAQGAYYNGSTSARLIAFGGKERTYMAWDYASPDDIAKYGRRYNPCGEYTDDAGNRAYYPNQYDYYTQHHFHLPVVTRLNEKFTLNVTAHYTRGFGYYEQYKTRRTLTEYGLQPFYDADGNKVKKSDLVRLKHLGSHFGGGMTNLTYKYERVNATFGGGANGYGGDHYGQVSWVRNYVGPIDPLQEYYRDRGTKFDASIFARADVQIVRNLSAYGDLQYRYINYNITGTTDTWDYNTDAPEVLDIHRRYNFFNPKAGLNFDTGKHRAFASWSVGRREPTRSDFTNADPRHMPRAERLFDYEAGYTFSTKSLTAGLNLYYMDYKDQMVATGQLSDTGKSLAVNVPDSYRLGVELQAAWQPLKWFTWSANATFSRNRIKNFVEYIYEDEWTNPITIDHGDTNISFSPSVVANNSFDFSAKDFEASLRTQYVSRQYLTNANTRPESLDGYCVSNLDLGYTFKNIHGIKALRLGVTVYNIFNKKYFANGWAAAGYTPGADGKPKIYRYAGFAAQAPANALGSVSLTF